MMIPRGRGPYDGELEAWPSPELVAPHEQTAIAAIAAIAQRGLGPCVRRRLTSISRLTTVEHSGVARGRPRGKREEMRAGPCHWRRGKMLAILGMTWGALIGVPVASASAASGGASQPSRGNAPQVDASRVSHRVVGNGKSSAAHKPAPALAPAHGKVITPPAPSSNPNNKAELGGIVHLGPAHPGAGRLIIPPPPAAQPARRSHSPRAPSTAPRSSTTSARSAGSASTRRRSPRAPTTRTWSSPAPTPTTTTAATARTRTPASTTPPTAASTGSSR